MNDDIKPPVESSVDAEAMEWEKAANDFSADIGFANKKDDKVVDNNPIIDKKDDTDKKDDDKIIDNKEDDKKNPEAGEDEKKLSAEDVTSRTVREQRAIQNEMLADETAVKDDIRKEMFDDVPTELLDADGDPIRTIEDVQKLMNPVTKKQFTEEQAAMWLLAAQQNLNKQLQDIERKTTEIASVNLSLKDESDIVNEKYGKLLETVPGLRKRVWAEYAKTLEKDEKTNIITKAPVSLEKFYDIALQGYAKLAEQMKASEEAEQKHAEEKATIQSQSDRSDIYSAGKTDTTSGEDKEWAKAAKEYYES